MNEEEQKRLFFGFEVHAPWPFSLPKARMVASIDRHLTIAFLGMTSTSKIEQILPEVPKPSFRVGPIGIFDKCLFLPKRESRVVAWHAIPIGTSNPITLYQKELTAWLRQNGYPLEERDFLFHVTLGRAPFVKEEWEKEFITLPLFYQNLHLYESIGHLSYKPIWSYPLLPPFEEIEHVADIAFGINGETLSQIYLHAQLALAFTFPEIIPFFDVRFSKTSIEDIIIGLNQIVTEADKEIGCPFKAVSFHGDIQKRDGNLLHWEMIVDV